MVSVALLAMSSFALAASQVKVYNEDRHDVSAPLRELAKSVTVQKTAPHEVEKRSVIPIKQLPLDPANPEKPSINGQGPAVGTTAGLNFDGQAADGVAPPDTTGAVGATQYVQWVNLEYNVYDKTTGAKILGPVAGNALWSGFGGACQTNNSGDPIVLYDKIAARWFFAQNTFSSPYTTCIAVSTGTDATGTFNRYAFTVTPSSAFPDYPKWGVWSNAYYEGFNNFKNGQTLTNGEACAIDRTAILAGNAATMQCFNTADSSHYTILPADIDGVTAPPAGEDERYIDFSDTGHVNFYVFHVDFAVPANSTFTGPTALVVPTFTKICGAVGSDTRSCVPQPTGGEKLDSLGDRMMYRFAYRNYTGTGAHEQWLASHTVGPVNNPSATAAVRWYEFRLTPKGAVGLFQSGTYQDAGTKNYWMSSIAADKVGDIALGFSVSDASTNPSLWYTGRKATDAKGTMQTANIIVTGGGVQKNTSNRWGDYSTMQIDPSDDCTFWFTGEYEKTTGSFNWSTRINSFKFTNCR